VGTCQDGFSASQAGSETRTRSPSRPTIKQLVGPRADEARQGVGQVAGGPFTLTVVAIDQYGNRVVTYTGTVNFTSNDPAANLPGPYTFTGVSGDRGSSAPQTATLNTVGVFRITVTNTGGTLTGFLDFTVS
jgi:hypothetical protein